MLILHDYRPSQNAWKIRVLLGLLDLPYETREVSIFEGEGQTDAFLKLNPTGAVPVLQLKDGQAIAESNAIMAYLADGTEFLPSDRVGRAKVDQWLCFEQYNVEPVIGSLRVWTLTGRLKRNAAMVPAKREAAVKTLTALDRSLADRAWLVGERLSIADLSVYAYTHLAGDCGIDLSTYRSVSVWLARVGEAVGRAFPVHPYSLDPHSHVAD
jgi:glutathione S-transferase